MRQRSHSVFPPGYQAPQSCWMNTDPSWWRTGFHMCGPSGSVAAWKPHEVTHCSFPVRVAIWADKASLMACEAHTRRVAQRPHASASSSRPCLSPSWRIARVCRGPSYTLSGSGLTLATTPCSVPSPVLWLLFQTFTPYPTLSILTTAGRLGLTSWGHSTFSPHTDFPAWAAVLPPSFSAPNPAPGTLLYPCPFSSLHFSFLAGFLF